MKHYILNEKGEPVEEPSILKWAFWFQKADRTVARTQLETCMVSTVFLGLDHNFDPDGGTPILWETMVFFTEKDAKVKCAMDHDMDICSGTREQAEAMHEKMVLKWMKYTSSLTNIAQ